LEKGRKEKSVGTERNKKDKKGKLQTVKNNGLRMGI
jgi:hypothetical protein